MILLAAGGSVALLAGAFVFQALGFAPCKLCLWQRWPHAAAILVGMVALSTRAYGLAWLGALAALSTAGIGAYHTGVERGWWQGPTSCTGAGNDLSGLSGADLLSTQIADTVIMCDEVAWAMLGLSMATWNMLFSLGLAVLWVMAARRT
ncbi:disulfide bond formation protein B [Aliiroseovarius sp. PTFE2010]|uniref:disulfide bond formation protein B n=1 Tax=Aliiroseovarius sp. PTFE2010 TaxID=3417190 RepID=UPI003CF7A945